MTDNNNEDDDDDVDDVDPFSCFDDDDDEDEDGPENDGNNVSTLPAAAATNTDDVTKDNQQRNSDCGILTFHAGTEQALLMYVEKQLKEEKKKIILNNDDDDYNNKLLLAQMVLDSIDEYCFHRHWMMHVGHEKGEIIKEFLQECCSSFSSSKQQQQQQKATINVLELGTYCGYSSILIAKVLRDILGGSSRSSSSSSKFMFYTIEVVEQNVNISRKMIQYAGFEDVIHVLHFNPYKESLSKFLKREINTFGPTTTDDDDDVTSKEEEEQQQHVDFLFIDHDKDLYLSDLQELESSGWIKKGCHVAADNVVFAGIDNYRNYTSDLQRQGIVSTQLKDTWLEYSIISPNDNNIGSSDEKNEPPFSKNEELRDGVELTIYLKDPSV